MFIYCNHLNILKELASTTMNDIENVRKGNTSFELKVVYTISTHPYVGLYYVLSVNATSLCDKVRFNIDF